MLLEDNEEIAASVAMILARLLILCGPVYVSRFETGSKGFTILQVRNRSFWRCAHVWFACFAVLFGVDVARLKPERFLDSQYFIQTLVMLNKTQIMYPAILPVIMAMLEQAAASLAVTNPEAPSPSDLQKDHDLVRRVLDLLQSLLNTFQSFRDFAVSSGFVKDMLKVLFSSLNILPDASSDGRRVPDLLQLDEADVPSKDSALDSPISVSTEDPHSSKQRQVTMRRRKSSFVMVSRPDLDGTARGRPPETRHGQSIETGGSITNKVVQILLQIFSDQIIDRKEFAGLGLFLKVPPCPSGSRGYINTVLMRKTMDRLLQDLSQKPNLFLDPKVLFNISKFCLQAYEACVEGWFHGGGRHIINFIGSLLSSLGQDTV